MLTHTFQDSIYYRVDCTCGNEDDQINFCIELEEDMQEVQITLDTIQKTDWWKKLADWDVYKIDNSWLFTIVNSIQELINGIYHRLKITRDVWLHGYVKYNTSTFLTKQAALNFAQALIDSVDTLEKNQKK